ncbi:sigma-70 family RNA polymerase sigma factor [Candidatus Poribacteria bacterium]
MSTYSDEQLVLEALDDSHPAFEQLVKQYQHRVLRTIASIISDEQAAQDVAQEAFLSAWSDLAKLKERHKFGGWLNQIAINLSKHWLRDQRRHHPDTIPLDEDVVVLTQELGYRREKLRQEIWEAIDGLAESYREIVILHYISGYSYKEIGEMLSVPFSTVSGRLQKAKDQLRKEFLDMVTQLQLEIDSTVHRFLKEHAKQDGVSVEGLILRLIERYKRNNDRPGIGVRKIEDWKGAWYYTGRPSPDSRYFSLIYWTGTLGVHDLTTGENHFITNDENAWGAPCGSSIWSPDGKQIAYSWDREGCNELRLVGPDGSKMRVLYNPEALESGIVPWDWSQDGKFILGRQGESKIVLFSVVDGSVRTLKSLEGHEWESGHRGSLSPDGCYVTYARSMEENGALAVFLLATDGSGEEMHLAGHTDSNDYCPVWTPDGKGIVSVCNRDPVGSTSLWFTPVVDGKQTGDPQLVIKGPGYIYPLGFTRDDSLYYSIESVPVAKIYVASVNMETGEVESQPTRLRCEGSNWHPAWSPDGKSLAYMSVRYSSKIGHHPTLVIRSMETGKEREFRTEISLSVHFSRLRWSPDGCSILCSKYLEGTYRHKLIDTQTGDATPILEPHHGMTLSYPEWSRDGKTLFYIRRYADKEWEFFSIVAHDLATGKERELYTDGRGWSCPMISPDGQELVFYDEAQTTIKVMPTAGGEPRVLHTSGDFERCFEQYIAGDMPDTFTQEYPVAWTPDGRHLLFIKGKRLSPDEKILELWRIPSEGGEPEKLRELNRQVYDELRNGSFHPDGQSIAFAMGDGEPLGHYPGHQRELWVMENLVTTFAADK